ncbi:sugar phosphate isomerase/epimerase family protein [Streptomyces cavernicola]|uniref:Sugar phosphate isomerase/epimerase family protein n=1 Tax=Streptomyces cavernicola TaxID=3043613 RepID=A0ABT6SCN0_9ACTN|nr:sugar phosphate isomerase/epimerase family protein [Streptomyces sp. B-S-A6]MDI3405720.1 sugar phosphate isomerase/epimerase family protein [Streptomyces sp. B-S-A6]
MPADTRPDPDASAPALAPAPAPAPALAFAPPPGIRYAGIGDEAAPGLAGQLDAVRQLGWNAVELRTVDGRALADLDDRAFGDLTEQLAATGTDVVCVDSRIADWSRPVTGPFALDTDELRTLARRCPALGTRHVRVMSYPDDGLAEPEWARRVKQRMTALARQAEDAGLVLLHENCAGWAGSRADRMLDLLAHVDSPALRLLFDTGNGVPYGYGATELLTAVLDHVGHVHIKDALPTGPGQAAYTLPGHGAAELRECLGLLLCTGWRGVWSIEPHTRLRPHDGTDARGEDSVDAFVAYGRELERLVAEEVLEAEAGAVPVPSAVPEPSAHVGGVHVGGAHV